ncbi:ICOS ligand-like [Acipenser ruthenus]|uniref:ICOS ligand-like n=1 Tax=Acipenser ruthenus TaxID=7906 RepID=UPI002740EAC0|nr:ICOS ligand-like [Acipenser ruthenus]
MSSVWIILLLLVMVCPVMSTGNGCVLGMIRSSVTIPCEYRNEGILERNNIAIEWRTSDSIVHGFVHGEDKLENQASQYKNRTKIFQSEVEHGNFSLRLSDITPEDETDYNCFFHKKGLSTSKHADTVCLIAAGHYTEPFLSTSHRENNEVDFTCTSSSGFPKPIVHWFINKKDISPEAGREHTTLDKDPSDGSFTVTSVLTVNVTQDLTVTCAIENERLGETRTSAPLYCHYTEPFLSTSRRENNEVDFTCTSSSGFPEPKVHWFINKKEILPEAGREHTTLDKDHCFTVTSVLTVNVTQDLTVTCAIENERLGETRTSAALYYYKQKPDNSQPSSNTGVIIGICVAFTITLVIGLGFLIYRRKKMPRRQQPQDGPEATYSAVSTS